MAGLGRTPWVDRTLQLAWDRIVPVAPKGLMPLVVEHGKRAHVQVEEHGCGLFGCVMPTEDPNVVVKLTSDQGEAFFIATALRFGYFPPGIVEYFGIYRVANAFHARDPLYITWREAASHIGWLDTASSEEADELRTALETYADAVYDILESRIQIEQAVGATKARQRIAAAIPLIEQTLETMPSEIADTLVYYYERNILIGDVHSGNIGLVGDELTPAITDPGGVVVLDEKLEQVEIVEV